MAGLAIDLVQVFSTLRDLHWEFLRLWTGFELSSSWANLPGYGPNRNRNILDFMRGGLTLASGHRISAAFNGQNHFKKNIWK
jgi:hypothetical protein